MVELAIILGIFGNLVFGLGLWGKLFLIKPLTLLLAVVLGGLMVQKKMWLAVWGFWKKVKKDKIALGLLAFGGAQAGVNLIGALGPELGFDALWYHLTIPKIYLQFGQIFYLRGGLYYYSAMPKLTEMFYLASLAFSPAGTLAKLIHFSFGLLSAAALYYLAKRYLKLRGALIAAVMFYTTLIVGWESISAYVDLSRTFFEILALDLFLRWSEKRKPADLYESAIMLGLALSVKLLAFFSLPVFLILTFWKSHKIQLVLKYFIFTLIVPLPWLIWSTLKTGNPIYPIFSGILDQTHALVLNPLSWGKEFFSFFIHPQDPISPIFLIFLPLLIFGLVKMIKENKNSGLKKLSFYFGGVMLGLMVTPNTGGARFLLPYLPVWSLLTVIMVEQSTRFLKRVLLVLVILTAGVNLGYRALANWKFVPVIIGRQSRTDFLSRNLKFDFGDFYDVDGRLDQLINHDWVYVIGGHNWFYADFPFVHESFSSFVPGLGYILTQNAILPEKFQGAREIYANSQTKIRLYLINPFGQND